MAFGAKGIAAMKPTPKVEATAKPKPSASAKSRALKEVIAALKSGDDEGAAEALGLAVKTCMAEYDKD